MNFIFKISISILILMSFSSWIFSEGDEGYFVYLRGKKQYVLVQGKGEPTIIFLTGKGRDQTDFKKVYNKLKKTNQIFAYDRSGIGQSELIKNNRTIDTMAFELHELLVKEKIKPPYILVGHAMGGSIMQCFVNRYPEMVSGMIFLDPTHEEEFKKGLDIRNDSDKIVFREQYRMFLKAPGKTKGHLAESKQCFDFDSLGYSTNQKILKQMMIPATIPITIILSTEPDVDNDYIDKEIEFRNQFFNQWKIINSRVKILNAPKTGYFIQREEPGLVINEINEMIGDIKNSSR